MNTVEIQLTPVLSRRTVNSAMAARGMRSAADLAQDKPCGTRVRYYAGCRCDACRRANTDYENARRAARARGERNGLVSAQRAREHLVWLSQRGVGRKTAADAAVVAASIVSKIIDGQRLKIRAQTERRILAVTEAAAADRAYIDGKATWILLDELLASGYSRALLASEILGHPARALQIKRGRVTARNAERVRRVYDRLRYAGSRDTARAQAKLQELREEGFRQDRVQRELTALAERRRLPEPTLEVAKRGLFVGCLRRCEVGLILAVHAAMVEGDAP